jgi:acetyl-CoA synthetase
MSVDAIADPVWEPTEAYLTRSRLRRLMAMHGIEAYDEFYRRSVDDIEWFWRTVVDDELELDWFRRFDRVLDLGDGPMWPRWFPGGSFNYVANAVDRHARGVRAHERAIVWEGEDGSSRSLTYTELDREVSSLAAGLRSLGVNRGDRVGIYMPLTPETAIATLACSKIGAIYIPTFSGYGAEAVAVRLRDGAAKVLITADGFHRRGRVVAMKETAHRRLSMWWCSHGWDVTSHGARIEMYGGRISPRPVPRSCQPSRPLPTTRS